jgi:hypothetical protein
MRKNSQFFIVLVFASLLVAFGCKRQDNPNYSIEDNSVLAKVVFNISTGKDQTTNPEQTKMTADAVQEDGHFRGMDATHLLAYSVPGQNHIYGSDLTADKFKVVRDFDLGYLLSSAAEASTTRTVELSIPLGTNVIALYGKATKTEGEDDAQGVVDLTHSPSVAIGTTPNTILFKLADRLSVDGERDFDEFSNLIQAMLTGFFRTGLVKETVADGFKVDRDLTYTFWYPIDENSEQWDTRTNTSTNAKAKVVQSGEPGEPITDNGNVDVHPGYTFYTGSIYWRDYGLQYAYNVNYLEGTYKEMKPLEEVLGQAYAEFCTIQKNSTNGTKELRAGSSSSLIRTISDLALVIEKVADTTPTSYEDEIAKLLAAELKTRLYRYFKKKSESSQELVFKSWDDMKVYVDAYTPYSSSTNFPHISDAFFAEETGFPINLHLPHGAAILTVEQAETNNKHYTTFKYLKKIPAYGMGASTYEMPIINYRYPPELMYYANSPLRVSPKADNVSFPVTLEAWDNDESWPSDTWSAEGASVESTTRSIAITKHVNYGNALLKTNVKYASGIDGLHDNNSILHSGESDNIISFDTGDALKVTGILIGGQPDFVGWNYLQASDADVNGQVVHGKAITSNTMDMLIYDKTAPFYVPAAGVSQTMYTLCWDNFDITKYTANPKENQGGVYIALELVNTSGRDFWGELNLVRKGGTFYLVGLLDPNDNTEGAVSEIPASLSRTSYFYPPYDTDGNTISEPRVFMQDFVTEATLVLGQHSLRHAYVTVPDLRGSQVSLGLSVDVHWSDGINFNNVIMGGN